MFKEKFQKAIERYIASGSPVERSRAKGGITKIVNSSTESNTLEQIQQILGEFDDRLPDLIRNRFTPGSLYREKDTVFGWYRENQVQAEAIPVDIPLTATGYLKVLANRDGFAEAVPLPLSRGVTVAVPNEQTFLYAKYGWANACSIQWYRDAEGYKVNRSIIPHGFWQAWKWWEDAQHWYLLHRPELFEDFECWGEEPDCRQPKAGDAVLGNREKEFWEQSLFYLE